MNNRIVVSIMAKDRPGIISDVTGVLYSFDGDLADLQQTVLCGYLSMILGVTLPATVSCLDIIEKIAALEGGKEFEISVKQLAAGEDFTPPSQPDETYVVTARGANCRGIVHSVSTICGRHNVNILDLSTSLHQNRYTMALQLDLSRATCSHDQLCREFEAYGAEAGQTIKMQHYDIFRATNEVTLH